MAESEVITIDPRLLAAMQGRERHDAQRRRLRQAVNAVAREACELGVMPEQAFYFFNPNAFVPPTWPTRPGVDPKGLYCRRCAVVEAMTNRIINGAAYDLFTSGKFYIREELAGGIECCESCGVVLDVTIGDSGIGAELEFLRSAAKTPGPSTLAYAYVIGSSALAGHFMVDHAAEVLTRIVHRLTVPAGDEMRLRAVKSRLWFRGIRRGIAGWLNSFSDELPTAE